MAVVVNNRRTHRKLNSRTAFRRLHITIVLCGFVFAFGQTPVISALSSAQQQVYDEGIYYFDVQSSTGTGGCTNTTLPAISDSAQVAQAINKYIQDSGGTGSPFDGLGDHIVAGATRAGVNPFLITAEAQHESSFGVHVPPDSYNAFGRSAVSGQPSATANNRQWYKWPSWAASVDSTDGTDESAFIKSVYVDQGQITLSDFVNKYAPASDGNDPTSYIQAVTDAINQMVTDAGNAVDCGQGGDTSGPAAPTNPTGNVALGKQLAAAYTWDAGSEWQCLYDMWQEESGWNNTSQNPTSTAYGIPQFLDSTWAGTGYSKTSDPTIQIKAGLTYIHARYKTPCDAWAFHKVHNWY